MDTRSEIHDKGVKRIVHPIVGELTPTYETMQLSASPGLMIAVYTAEAGSKSAEALDLLANWTATPDEASAPSLGDGV